MNWLPALVAATISASACASAPLAPAAPVRSDVDPCPAELPHKVSVEFGEAEFLPADTVLLSSVCGSAPRFELGGRYQLRGTYRLASRERASLVLAVTDNNETNRTPTRPATTSKSVVGGTGAFVLTLALQYEGFPHLTMYDDDGHPFGGFYFGTEHWLLPHKDWSYSRPIPEQRAPDPREQTFELL